MKLIGKKYKSIIIIQKYYRRYVGKINTYELLRNSLLYEDKQWYPKLYGMNLFNRKDNENNNYLALWRIYLGKH